VRSIILIGLFISVLVLGYSGEIDSVQVADPEKNEIIQIDTVSSDQNLKKRSVNRGFIGMGIAGAVLTGLGYNVVISSGVLILQAFATSYVISLPLLAVARTYQEFLYMCTQNLMYKHFELVALGLVIAGSSIMTIGLVLMVAGFVNSVKSKQRNNISLFIENGFPYTTLGLNIKL